MRSQKSMIPAAALLIVLSISAAAQIPPDPGAAANIRESEQYSALLRSSPAFRAKRMQIECGPITDPELHASCVSSFQAYGPMPANSRRPR